MAWDPTAVAVANIITPGAQKNGGFNSKWGTEKDFMYEEGTDDTFKERNWRKFNEKMSTNVQAEWREQTRMVQHPGANENIISLPSLGCKGQGKKAMTVIQRKDYILQLGSCGFGQRITDTVKKNKNHYIFHLSLFCVLPISPVGQTQGETRGQKVQVMHCKVLSLPGH